MAQKEWSHVCSFDRVAESDFEKTFATALRAGKRGNRYSNVLANEPTMFPSSTCVLQPSHSPAKMKISADDAQNLYPYLCANIFSPASFHDCPHTFIACQAPIPQQIENFWLSMLQYEVPLILMLTKTEEGGNHKAHTYWPMRVNAPVKLPSTGITIELKSAQTAAISKEIVERVVAITSPDGSIQHTLKQVQYLGWPDFGVPNDHKTFEKLVEMCESVEVNNNALNSTSKKVNPIVVHCSAGIGRTGTLMGVYYGRHLLSTAAKGQLNDVTAARRAVLDIVCRMKQTRTGMVQRPEQMAFVFKCLGFK